MSPKNVLIGVNTLEVIDQPIYSNHAQFYFRLGRDYPETNFALNHPRRMSIDRMRNVTAKIAVENGFDYLMFVDDDVLIPRFAFRDLLAADKDIVAGWTCIRGYPFHNMFFQWEDKESKTTLKPYDEFEENSNSLDLLEVAAVGFSCVLIKVELLKKIPPPWFVTGIRNTEDIYFCMKAVQYVPEISIFVHLGVKTEHLIGQEGVGPSNRAALKTYFESVYPEMCQGEIKATDRGDEYVKLIGAV